MEYYILKLYQKEKKSVQIWNKDLADLVQKEIYCYLFNNYDDIND